MEIFDQEYIRILKGHVQLPTHYFIKKTSISFAFEPWAYRKELELESTCNA